MHQNRRLTLSVATLGLLSVLSAPSLAQEVLVGDLTGDRIVRFDWPSGQVFDHFVGSGVSELNGPRAMCLGPDGMLYVASQINDSVLRVDASNGRVLGTFVRSGPGVDLNSPRGLAFDAHGDLYVTSSANDKVLKFDGETGAFLSEFIERGDEGPNGPADILFEAGGDTVLVSARSGDNVLRYDASTGAFLEEVLAPAEMGLEEPTGLLALAGGRILVCSAGSNRIIELAPDGSASVFAAPASPVLDQPEDIVQAPDGSLLVVFSGGTGGVQQFDNDGEFLRLFIAGGSGGMNGDPVSLLILPATCQADFNDDGSLDIFDFLAFQNAFDAGCP
ncbi:MAG: hypothetical protein ACIAS6_01520 [Phycisphaerales bacterium JB060]